jgi:hypothetical protein
MRHLIVGTVLIALGIWGMSTWWETFGLFMRALVPFALLVFGLLAVLSSYAKLSGTRDHAVVDEENAPEEE